MYCKPCVYALQSKLAVKDGGVIKGGKKGKKALKRLALKALETAPSVDGPDSSPATSPSPRSSSPNSSPGIAEQQNAEEAACELGSSSNHSSMSQQADAGLSTDPSCNISQPDRQKSPSPLTGMVSGNTPEQGVSTATPEIGTSPPKSATGDEVDPQPSKAVANKSQSKPSAPLAARKDTGLEGGGGVLGWSPSKNTPSKATPNKRPREAVCGSPAANCPVVDAARGLEAGLREGTPGKRRRSLLPQAPQKESTQV